MQSAGGSAIGGDYRENCHNQTHSDLLDLGYGRSERTGSGGALLLPSLKSEGVSGVGANNENSDIELALKFADLSEEEALALALNQSITDGGWVDSGRNSVVAGGATANESSYFSNQSNISNRSVAPAFQEDPELRAGTLCYSTLENDIYARNLQNTNKQLLNSISVPVFSIHAYLQLWQRHWARTWDSTRKDKLPLLTAFP